MLKNVRCSANFSEHLKRHKDLFKLSASNWSKANSESFAPMRNFPSTFKLYKIFEYAQDVNTEQFWKKWPFYVCSYMFKFNHKICGHVWKVRCCSTRLMFEMMFDLTLFQIRPKYGIFPNTTIDQSLLFLARFIWHTKVSKSNAFAYFSVLKLAYATLK